MKHSLTRLAVALTALYWISGIVLAITSAALEPQSGWLVFVWYQLAEIIILYYVVPLTALLWGLRTPCGPQRGYASIVKLNPRKRLWAPRQFG
jgi:hypothetical protein